MMKIISKGQTIFYKISKEKMRSSTFLVAEDRFVTMETSR